MLDTLRKWFFMGLLAAIALVMSVNFAVRTIGNGYPHILSPFHFENKVQALARLGKHYLQHPFMDRDESTVRNSCVTTRTKQGSLLLRESRRTSGIKFMTNRSVARSNGSDATDAGNNSGYD